MYGPLYSVHTLLNVAFLPLFIWLSFRQIQRQAQLDRIRLKHIVVAAFVTIFFMIVFQLVLPAFDIWLLEREIVFLLSFFVIYTVFTVKRYYFSALGYRI